MNTDKIEVGDLVMIVKPTPCCNSHNSVGEIHEVVGGTITEFLVCIDCHKRKPVTTHVILSDECAIERERLRKIPPLSELESRDERETVRV